MMEEIVAIAVADDPPTVEEMERNAAERGNTEAITSMMEENVAIAVVAPPTMEEKVRTAAGGDNIKAITSTTEENVAIAITGPDPRTMEERLRNATERGNIEALYGLIREKANFLKDIDEMEFVDTPLHMAAAAGRTEFAMELMCLKPSFLTKLNQDGLSPIHLALRNEHSETVLSLLKFDKNLPRLKGKNCYTPLHYVAMKGDLGVLIQFLKDCPECIQDVTNRDETALHLAAQNDNFEALQTMLKWLRMADDYSVSQIREIENSKNKDGQTVWHIAASKNQPAEDMAASKNQPAEMMQDQSGVIHTNGKATNSNDLGTQQQNQEENNQRRLDALNNYLSALLDILDQIAYEIGNMSGDGTTGLLIAAVLILTATYQAGLQPPGGFSQPNQAGPNPPGGFSQPNSQPRRPYPQNYVLENTPGCPPPSPPQNKNFPSLPPPPPSPPQNKNFPSLPPPPPSPPQNKNIPSSPPPPPPLPPQHKPSPSPPPPSLTPQPKSSVSPPSRKNFPPPPPPSPAPAPADQSINNNFPSKLGSSPPRPPGSSVLSKPDFLSFSIPNIGAFCLSFFVTCFALISMLPGFVSSILILSLSMLLGSLIISEAEITSPNSRSLHFMVEYGFIPVYITSLVIGVALARRLQKIIWRRNFTRAINNQ